jgi:hypothetical protein
MTRISAQGEMVQQVLLYPLVITRDTDGGACVSGCTEDGLWFRPEPVTADEVEGTDPLYQYFRPVHVGLSASHERDARPEDRNIAMAASPAGQALSEAERDNLLRKVADPSVEDAFAGERSVGVVELTARRVYAQRSTGGRTFLRLEFSDSPGKAFDWIIRDVQLLRAFPEPGAARAELEELSAVVAAAPRFVSVGLTKPDGRFPGRFRGCHPLVVGLHGIVRDLEGLGHASGAA